MKLFRKFVMVNNPVLSAPWMVGHAYPKKESRG